MVEQNELLPVQPYLPLEADHYRRISGNGVGISEFYEFTIAEDGVHQFYAVPDGSVDLVFGIREQDVHASIGGPVLQVKQWMFEPGRTYFGVRFYPGQCLLPDGLTIQEVVNTDLCLDVDRFEDYLAERIANGTSIQERSQIFLRTYSKKFSELQGTRYNLERYIRKRIYETNGTISIQALCEETGYSACYVRRTFEQVHGISPKLFERFIRFQHMLHLMEQNITNNRMDELAILCGYYDQSHMMKDFKCFSGKTPEQYRSLLLSNMSV